MPRAISLSSSSAPVTSATASIEFRASSPSSGGTAACAARSFSASETSRCWAPSCRSRSIRRRAWSAAATIRARDGGHLGLRLGVGDRGGHQLGEPGQPRLGVGGQQLPRRTHATMPHS